MYIYIYSGGERWRQAESFRSITRVTKHRDVIYIYTRLAEAIRTALINMVFFFHSIPAAALDNVLATQDDDTLH
jgi:hypothetical protein